MKFRFTMTSGRLLVLFCAALACFRAQALLVDDTFGNLDNWDILDMKGNADVGITTDWSTPPPFEKTVLNVHGDGVIALAKGARLSEGTILALYRELAPRDEDADGIILFHGQYGDDLSVEHNTKQVRDHIWLELDNDTGIHFTRTDANGKETQLAADPGIGLVTDSWNRTGWIWQKVAVSGNAFRAKFWPAELPEPEGWQLEGHDPELAGGRIGFRIGSGHIHIACFRADPGDITVTPPVWYLVPENDRITRPEAVALTLFTNLPAAGTHGLTFAVESGGNELKRADLPLELPSGPHAAPLLLATEKTDAPEDVLRINLPEPLPTGTGIVRVSEGDKPLTETQVTVMPVAEVRGRFDRIKQTADRLRETLDGVPWKSDKCVKRLQILADAAYAHHDYGLSRLDSGDIEGAERSLRFAREALAELRGYKGVWLHNMAPQCVLDLPEAPPLETLADGEKPRLWYSPQYLIHFAAPRMEADSLVMGRSYKVVIPWIAEGKPDRDFQFHVELSDPLGQRMVAVSDATPDIPTSQWQPGKCYEQRVTLAVIAENASAQHPEPLVLDEMHQLLIRVTDPESGATLLIDNPPTPRVCVPETAFLAGSYYVSSTPLEIRRFMPIDGEVNQLREDDVVIRNSGDTPQAAQALFSVYTETDRLLLREAREIALEPGAEMPLNFVWKPDWAAKLRMKLELLREGAILTRAEIEPEITTPQIYGVRVSCGGPARAAGDGQVLTQVSISTGAADSGPIQARVLHEGRVIGEGKSGTGNLVVEVEPCFGYYDVEVETARYRWCRRIIGTVVEVRGGRLLVNGEPFLVKGINVHGMDGSSPAKTCLQMELMKGLGFNMWRGDYPGRWQTDLAYAENTAYSVLAPFSCAPTDEIFQRQSGVMLSASRELARLFLERYVDSAGVLLWNSCNEIAGETTDFILSLYPVFHRLDPYQRPVHYANLYGQDRWQGQDVMGINYYFNLKETPADRQPVILRSIELGREHGLPALYTEYNSYHGPVHSTGVAAVKGLFEWGVEQGMAGGFFYMRYNSESHPSVFNRNLNTHYILDEALRHAFADAEITLADASPNTLRLHIRNRRDFTLRGCVLNLQVNDVAVNTPALADLPPQGTCDVEMPLPEDMAAHALEITGEFTCTTHHGFQSATAIRIDTPHKRTQGR